MSLVTNSCFNYQGTNCVLFRIIYTRKDIVYHKRKKGKAGTWKKWGKDKTGWGKKNGQKKRWGIKINEVSFERTKELKSHRREIMKDNNS